MNRDDYLWVFLKALGVLLAISGILSTVEFFVATDDLPEAASSTILWAGVIARFILSFLLIVFADGILKLLSPQRRATSEGPEGFDRDTFYREDEARRYLKKSERDRQYERWKKERGLE